MYTNCHGAVGESQLSDADRKLTEKHKALSCFIK